MKILLVLSALVGLAWSYEPIMTDYHEEYGIPRMAEIEAMEKNLDFDGARITGGSTANAGAHPHLVGLIILLTDGRQSACGGSMLSNTRTLTAAHCWRHGGNQARSFTLVFGSATLLSGGTRVSTNTIFMHASYNEISLANDIAVLGHNWVGYNNVINRILIPTGNSDYAGTWAAAAGFGRTNDAGGNAASPRKHHVNLQVITNAACRNSYGTWIQTTTLCATGSNRQSICPGDSGGPLAIGSGNNRQIIGVTSFTHTDGCTRGHPSGFARVTSFRSWIQARM